MSLWSEATDDTRRLGTFLIKPSTVITSSRCLNLNDSINWLCSFSASYKVYWRVLLGVIRIMETDTICLNLIYIYFNCVLNTGIVFIEFQHEWNYLLRSVFSWWSNYIWCFWPENVTRIIRLRRKGIFPLWTPAIRQPLKKYFPWFIELMTFYSIKLVTY